MILEENKKYYAVLNIGEGFNITEFAIKKINKQSKTLVFKPAGGKEYSLNCPDECWKRRKDNEIVVKIKGKGYGSSWSYHGTSFSWNETIIQVAETKEELVDIYEKKQKEYEITTLKRTVSRTKSDKEKTESRLVVEEIDLINLTKTVNDLKELYLAQDETIKKSTERLIELGVEV